MNEHVVTLLSEEGYGSKAPPEEVGLVLRIIGPGIRKSVLMAVQGRSTAKGRYPAWLGRASDIRFVGIGGRRETKLHFEAPTMGESAPELFEQKEFWPTKPAAESTGFDLFAITIDEAGAGRADSDRYDRQLLSTLLGFGAVLNGRFQEIRVSRTAARNGHKEAIINKSTIEEASRLRDATPEPRSVRVAGILDMVRYSNRGFELLLDDGDTARGILVEGGMDSLRDLMNRRTLIEGNAVYRPSGKLLRIEAHSVTDGEGAPGLWSRIPNPIAKKLDKKTLRKRQTSRSGVNAFFGTWPGDETDEEVLSALEVIS